MPFPLLGIRPGTYEEALLEYDIFHLGIVSSDPDVLRRFSHN